MRIGVDENMHILKIFSNVCIRVKYVSPHIYRHICISTILMDLVEYKSSYVQYLNFLKIYCKKQKCEIGYITKYKATAFSTL